MAYADYTYYQEVYGGVVVNDLDFTRLAQKASAYIDYVTLGRAKGMADQDGVKMACCALAEHYSVADIARMAAQKSMMTALQKDESGEVQSETVGSWSKSYRSGADSASGALQVAGASATDDSLREIAEMYLGPLGLLRARGFYA